MTSLHMNISDCLEVNLFSIHKESQLDWIIGGIDYFLLLLKFVQNLFYAVATSFQLLLHHTQIRLGSLLISSTVAQEFHPEDSKMVHWTNEKSF